MTRCASCGIFEFSTENTGQEQQTGGLVMASSGDAPEVHGGSKELNSGDHGGCCSGCVIV